MVLITAQPNYGYQDKPNYPTMLNCENNRLCFWNIEKLEFSDQDQKIMCSLNYGAVNGDNLPLSVSSIEPLVLVLPI
jgi:hypothetical protein